MAPSGRLNGPRVTHNGASLHRRYSSDTNIPVSRVSSAALTRPPGRGQTAWPRPAAAPQPIPHRRGLLVPPQRPADRPRQTAPHQPSPSRQARRPRGRRDGHLPRYSPPWRTRSRRTSGRCGSSPWPTRTTPTTPCRHGSCSGTCAGATRTPATPPSWPPNGANAPVSAARGAFGGAVDHWQQRPEDPRHGGLLGHLLGRTTGDLHTRFGLHQGHCTDPIAVIRVLPVGRVLQDRRKLIMRHQFPGLEALLP